MAMEAQPVLITSETTCIISSFRMNNFLRILFRQSRKGFMSARGTSSASWSKRKQGLNT